MSEVQTIKDAIWNTFQDWPVFRIVEIDNYDNEETYLIDTFLLEPGRDDFLLSYTRDIFQALIDGHTTIEVGETNSFTDTNFYTSLDILIEECVGRKTATIEVFVDVGELNEYYDEDDEDYEDEDEDYHL